LAQAKLGDTVRVHYSGYLEDETMFDSSLDRESLEVTLGQHKIIPGFEDVLIGMNEGDTKKVSISAEDGYGHHRPDLVVPVKRSHLPANIKPETGMILHVRSDDGTAAKVRIVNITEDTVTLDGNHPLAEKKLTFEIRLLEII